LTVVKETTSGDGVIRSFSGAPPGIPVFSDSFSAVDASGFWRKLSPSAVTDKWVRAKYDSSDRGFQQPMLLKWERTFSPLDLTPALWLDASDESTLSGPGGGAVSTWSDKSGNGNELTQATSANQPTTGTRTMNGLNVLDFSSDALSLAGFTTTSPYTVIAVFAPDTNTGTQYIWAADGATAVGYTGNDVFNLLNDGLVINGSSVGTFGQELVLWENDGAGSQIRRNGSVYASGTVGTVGMGEINIGNRDDFNRAFDGTIAEVIVVDGTLTADQISATETYLADKWGISI